MASSTLALARSAASSALAVSSRKALSCATRAAAAAASAASARSTCTLRRAWVFFHSKVTLITSCRAVDASSCARSCSARALQCRQNSSAAANTAAAATDAIATSTVLEPPTVASWPAAWAARAPCSTSISAAAWPSASSVATTARVSSSRGCTTSAVEAAVAAIVCSWAALELEDSAERACEAANCASSRFLIAAASTSCTAANSVTPDAEPLYTGAFTASSATTGDEECTGFTSPLWSGCDEDTDDSSAAILIKECASSLSPLWSGCAKESPVPPAAVHTGECAGSISPL
eukprot:scaffold211079_cov25-Tisochrysis_lutea.AAC.7